VPWTYVAPKGQKPTIVWASATKTKVDAYIEDRWVTDHDRTGPGRRSTKDAHLPEHRRDHRHRDPAYWRERAAGFGAEVSALIGAVLDHDPVKSRVDTACACLRLLEQLDEDRRSSVTRHALRFGNVHLGEIKRIVENELDRHQEAAPTVTNCWTDHSPAFARSGEEYQQRVDTSWTTAARKETEVTHATA